MEAPCGSAQDWARVGLGIVMLELKSGEDVGGYKHKLEAQLLLNRLLYI
jgi:hypothetical protein